MSEAKFTKGPWIVNSNGSYFNIGPKNDCSSVPVYPDACMGVMHCDEANANLIAAAPEMYEMLDDAWRVIYGLIDEVNDQRMSRVHSQTETPPDLYDMESIHLIQSLLAKARGEK